MSPDAAERERRRRAAELLGDLLPESTRDDLPDRETGPSARQAHEAELLRDVPPHHG